MITVDIDDLKESGRNTEVHLVKVTHDEAGQFEIQYDEPMRQYHAPTAIEVIKCAAMNSEGALIASSVTGRIKAYPKVVDDGGGELNWHLTRDAGKKYAHFYIEAPSEGTTPSSYNKIHFTFGHSTPR